MFIQAVLIVGLETGVGIISASAYDATWKQAVIYSAVNAVVTIILLDLVDSYVQDTRQLALAQIAIQVTAGLAGVLMTRFLCEETIRWKTALACSLCSVTALSYACRLFFMDPEPFTEIFD